MSYKPLFQVKNPFMLKIGLLHEYTNFYNKPQYFSNNTKIDTRLD